MTQIVYDLHDKIMRYHDNQENLRSKLTEGRLSSYQKNRPVLQGDFHSCVGEYY